MKIGHIALAIATLGSLAYCCRSSRSSSVKSSPDQGAQVSPDPFPNVRVRLRLRSQSPALPERTIEQTIWLRGSRFRVRDEAGRDLAEILGDVTAPSGLGAPVRTMEEIMDRRAAARRPAAGVTEIFGDLATDAGWLYQTGSPRWSQPARELAPIARQALADDRAAGLLSSGAVARLGRSATEYRGVLEVVENGASRRNTVVCVISPPYLLLHDIRDVGNANHFYIREVVALDTDGVSDADVTPP